MFENDFSFKVFFFFDLHKKKCIGIFIKNETSSLQLLSVKSTKIVANLLLVIFLKALDSYKLVNYRYCRD